MTTKRNDPFVDLPESAYTRQLAGVPEMGASRAGCKCQSRWIIHWEDGEIKDMDSVTVAPAHLRDLENPRNSYLRERLFKKEGKWFEKLEQGGFA